MTSLSEHSTARVSDEWLMSYSAGTLSMPKQMVISCQAALKPELARDLSMLDCVGGVTLESAPAAELSDDFLARLTDRLDADDEEARPIGTQASASAPEWMPQPLSDTLKGADKDLKWRRVGPQVEYAPIYSTNNDEHLYMLRAPAGVSLPRHTHQGEEWTLILEGGYHVGEQGYVAGDVHCEDENCTHQPVIDDDGPCIALIAIEGKLRFKNPILRMVQPLIGL